jgi:antibiotic biosynthesis monooxygenase (ABM) superfamily enzyme
MWKQIVLVLLLAYACFLGLALCTPLREHISPAVSIFIASVLLAAILGAIAGWFLPP